LDRQVAPVRRPQLLDEHAVGPRPGPEQLQLQLQHPVEVVLPQRPQQRLARRGRLLGHVARLRAPATWTSGRRRYSGVSGVGAPTRRKASATSTSATGVTADSASGSATSDRKSTRLNSSHVKISYAVF